MSTNRAEFKPTHLAAYRDLERFEELEGEPIQLLVLQDGSNAFNRDEWNDGRPLALITFDDSRKQWCYNGGFKTVVLTPLSDAAK